MDEVIDPLGFPGVPPRAAVLPVLVMVIRLSLRHLILVVRERQVYPAAVDVYGLPQLLARHSRALNVPPCTLTNLWADWAQRAHGWVQRALMAALSVALISV